jgi:hypothetical protein
MTETHRRQARGSQTLVDMDALAKKEPRIVRFLELIRALPRSDGTPLQGDVPQVREAELCYHGFNSKYQRRVTDKHGNNKAARDPLLIELFKLADWVNFQKLVQNSTIGKERKKNANKRHLDKKRRERPELILESNRKKRRARIEAWQTENNPGFLRLIAEAFPLGKKLGHHPEVINALEARFVDEPRADWEYAHLCLRVAAGQHTQVNTKESLERLTRIINYVHEDDAEVELKKILEQRLPAITTDVNVLLKAVDQQFDKQAADEEDEPEPEPDDFHDHNDVDQEPEDDHDDGDDA